MHRGPKVCKQHGGIRRPGAVAPPEVEGACSRAGHRERGFFLIPKRMYSILGGTVVEHALAKLAVTRASNLRLLPSSLLPRDRFRLPALAGRLVELSGRQASASITAVCTLILEAQIAGQPVIWISAVPTLFFPPDLAHNGVDLAALPVVRAWNPECTTARASTRAPASAAARAAVHLLRSGGFGLVIMDLDEPLHPTAGGTLARLARAANTAVVVLTATSRPSDSMVSLRGQTRTHRCAPGVFRCEVHVTRDRRHGAGSRIGELCHAPDGMR